MTGIDLKQHKVTMKMSWLVVGPGDDDVRGDDDESTNDTNNDNGMVPWWRKKTRCWRFLVHHIWNSKRLPWILCFLLSLVYGLALLSRVSCDHNNIQVNHKTDMDTMSFPSMCWPPLVNMTAGLHGGFCVWGANDQGECPSQANNSHQYSGYLDVGLTIVALWIGWRRCINTRNNKGTTKHWWYTVGIAVMIGLHGLLHLVISRGVDCLDGYNIAVNDDTGNLQEWHHCWQTCPGTPCPPWNLALYATYNLGLVSMVVWMISLPISLWEQLLLVAAITTAFVAMGIYVGAIWALPCVFVQSHILVSVAGLFAGGRMDRICNSTAARESKNTSPFIITPLVGWCFLTATSVGLLEFLACQPILMHWYGHVCYDAVLHLAMIATLIPSKN